ncbi:hypothetical protein FGO68_gene2066 [Halteria grandinella]|uniref:C2H2-type domain-containing protein n=1 Tax=Halteria grandinella TaxID=5974 RepID=A0A8J8NX74_HALGN|nr:hypothetical protein FGO68_gene2066 [Halteria grandinella]
MQNDHHQSSTIEYLNAANKRPLVHQKASITQMPINDDKERLPLPLEQIMADNTSAITHSRELGSVIGFQKVGRSVQMADNDSLNDFMNNKGQSCKVSLKPEDLTFLPIRLLPLPQNIKYRSSECQLYQNHSLLNNKRGVIFASHGTTDTMSQPISQLKSESQYFSLQLSQQCQGNQIDHFARPDLQEAPSISCKLPPMHIVLQSLRSEVGADLLLIRQNEISADQASMGIQHCVESNQLQSLCTHQSKQQHQCLQDPKLSNFALRAPQLPLQFLRQLPEELERVKQQKHLNKDHDVLYGIDQGFERQFGWDNQQIASNVIDNGIFSSSQRNQNQLAHVHQQSLLIEDLQDSCKTYPIDLIHDFPSAKQFQPKLLIGGKLCQQNVPSEIEQSSTALLKNSIFGESKGMVELECEGMYAESEQETTFIDTKTKEFNRRIDEARRIMDSSSPSCVPKQYQEIDEISDESIRREIPQGVQIQVILGKDFDVTSLKIEEEIPATRQFRIYKYKNPRTQRYVKLLKCDHNEGANHKGQNTCGMYFRKWHNFFDHLRVHTKQRPFKCPLQGCEQAFTQKANLHKHLDVHKKKITFDCHKCRRRFQTVVQYEVSKHQLNIFLDALDDMQRNATQRTSNLKDLSQGIRQKLDNFIS